MTYSVDLDLHAGADIIQRASMSERALLVSRLHRQHLGGWTPWAAIVASLRSFQSTAWEPGTWVSHVDAYVVESLARGVALAIHGEENDYDNPAAQRWAEYLTRWHHLDSAGGDRRLHDREWADAEQVATDHGKAMAARAGITYTEHEYRWYLYSCMYRSIMRDPSIRWIPGWLCGPVMDWFTDVTRPEPVLNAADTAHALSRLDLVRATTGASRIALAGARGILNSVVTSQTESAPPARGGRNRNLDTEVRYRRPQVYDPPWNPIGGGSAHELERHIARGSHANSRH